MGAGDGAVSNVGIGVGVDMFAGGGEEAGVAVGGVMMTGEKAGGVGDGVATGVAV